MANPDSILIAKLLGNLYNEVFQRRNKRENKSLNKSVHQLESVRIKDEGINTTVHSEKSGALFVAANTESLDINDNASLSTGDIDWTFAIEFSFNSIFLDNFPTLAHKGFVSSQVEWSLYYSIPAKYFQCRFFKTTSLSGIDLNWSIVPVSGVSYMLVVYHDSINDIVSIILDDQTPVTASYSLGMQDGTAPFQIGGRQNQDNLDGQVFRAGFWKKILTTSDITTLRNNGNMLSHNELNASLLTNLEAYWDMDESSGTRFDSAGSNNLTDVNTVLFGPSSLTDFRYSPSPGAYSDQVDREPVIGVYGNGFYS